MTDKKVCDCNQGRLPCSCIPAEPGTQETLAAVCTTPAGNECPGDGVGSCKTCNGRGLVDDGEINCFEDGTPYSNGPVKCVKDCPDCRPEQPEVVATVKTMGFGRQYAEGFGEPIDKLAPGEELMTVAQHKRIIDICARRMDQLEAEKYAMEDQVRGLQELMAQQDAGKIVVTREVVCRTISALKGRMCRSCDDGACCMPEVRDAVGELRTLLDAGKGTGDDE